MRKYLNLLAASVLAALCAFSLSAQEYVPLQFNVPYHCANGIVYTFLKCAGSGYKEVCTWREEQNGHFVTEAYSQRVYLKGRIAGCTIGSAPTSQAPAAQQTTSAGGATDPPYLVEMPSVEKVKSVIQGTSPEDTLARQVAVFTYLPQIVLRMQDRNRKYGSSTPDEQRIAGAYSQAAYQLTQAYEKSHSPQQAKVFQGMHWRYETDGKFFNEWFSALFTPEFRAAYNAAVAGRLADYRAHVAREQQTYDEATARQKAAAEAAKNPAGGLPQDAGSVEGRRCLELGGSKLTCLGKALKTGMFDFLGVNPDNIITDTSSHYAGLTVTGKYNSRNGIGADFGDTKVAVDHCGNLIIDNLSYRIERKGDGILVHVANSPAPFSFFLQPDGRLVGPPAANITGKVIVGYNRYWAFQRYASTGEVVPGTGHWEQQPIYADKTQSCAIGTLLPTGPSAGGGSILESVAQATDQILKGPSAKSSPEKQLPPPSIRMAGVYSSQGGLRAEFQTASVILDCGRAHVRDQYIVERAGGRLVLHIQNAGSPFTATVQPDGSLAGPASVVVAGRIATSMSGDQVNFVLVTTSCPASTLIARESAAGSPEGEADGSSAAAAQNEVAPSMTGGNAGLSVASGFPGNPNPLAGKGVFLVKTTFDDVMKRLVPSATSAGQAWMAVARACRPPKDCSAMQSAIGKEVAGKLILSGDGRGALPSNVPAGTYYVMCVAAVNNTLMIWHVPVNLKPGANSFVLDSRVAEVAK